MFKRISKHHGPQFLCEYLDDSVDSSKMEAAFGDCNLNGYYDPENGYDGVEWTFEGQDDQCYTVYSRHGIWRVSSSHEDVSDFVLWLKSQID